MKPNNFFNRKELKLIFLLYIIVVVKSVYSSALGFDLLDEGEYLHIGLRILQGQIPYQDFFSYLPILYDYWNVIAFKIFGISAFSPRFLNSLIFSFVPVLYFIIAKRFSSNMIAFLIALSFGFMELSMERLHYHIFTFGALFFYFIYLREKKKEYGLLAGLLLGLLALFRIDVALQFFLGLVLTTILKSPKQLTIICSGFLVPISIFVYWLLSHNLLERFIQITITTPTEFAAAQNFPFPKPWNILPQSFLAKEIFVSYEVFFMYLIIAIYLLGLYFLIKNWKNVWKNMPELSTFLIIAIFTTPYIFSRPDLGHMIKGGIPAFFIAAFLLEKLRSNFKFLLVIPVILITVGIAQIIWWTSFFDSTIETPNGRIRTSSTAIKNTSLVSADTIKKSLDFINTNTKPGEQILAIPYMSGIYFLSNRPSNLYVGNIYYGYIPDEEKFVEQLKSKIPKIVIYDFSYKPRGYVKSLNQFYPKIDKFIMDNYRVIDESPEGWLFMVKKNPKI